MDTFGKLLFVILFTVYHLYLYHIIFQQDLCISRYPSHILHGIFTAFSFSAFDFVSSDVLLCFHTVRHCLLYLQMCEHEPPWSLRWARDHLRALLAGATGCATSLILQGERTEDIRRIRIRIVITFVIDIRTI